MSVAERRGNARDALIEAAAELFVAKGFEAVSTRELAEAAGVNLGAIQYHFGSKAKLFVEAVQHLMRRRGFVQAPGALVNPDRRSAMVALCTLIRNLLCSMVANDQPQPCRLMYREVFSDCSREPEMYEALVGSVVEEFIRPLDRSMLELLAVLLPDVSPRRRQLVVHSIIGQCSFYVTHRPFIARLRGASPCDEALSEVVEHIATFTLRGMGVDSAEFREVMNEVFGG